MNLGDPIAGVEPFRLSRDWQAKPSTFAIRLLINGTEYQYGLSATREKSQGWLHVKREGGRAVPAFSANMARLKMPPNGTREAAQGTSQGGDQGDERQWPFLSQAHR